MAAPGPGRRSRHPLRWLERRLFLVYGPADVRDPESRRAAAPPPAGGPETVRGETVPTVPRGAVALDAGATASAVPGARSFSPGRGPSAL